MYQLVHNPYAPRRSSSPAACCLLFCVAILTAVTVAGLFAFRDYISKGIFVSTAPLQETELSAAFADFVVSYGKQYNTMEETEYRFKIFVQTYKMINEHNANPDSTSTLGINQFADLTDEEFQRLYLSKPRSSNEPATSPIKPPPNPDLNINWVERGKVTKVKDQGNCGSCWTFSAISVVETLVAIIRNKDPERYSEQQLVDCCRTFQSQGCDGGEETDAFDYLRDKGAMFESAYPYKAVDDVCKYNKDAVAVRIKEYLNITDGDNAKMEEIITSRTISVGVAASHYVFRYYRSGVVTTGCPGDHISHAVTVVGAGTENGVPYWLVRNSWGPHWGDHGYMKIARVSDNTNGVCGISCCAQYIEFNK